MKNKNEGFLLKRKSLTLEVNKVEAKANLHCTFSRTTTPTPQSHRSKTFTT
jgi:hypothetical protein